MSQEPNSFQSTSTQTLRNDFYRRDPREVARDLIGRYIIRTLEDQTLIVRIVETEAYLGTPDPASHAYQGRRTQRNASLYLEGGHAYVYFVYGMHFCLNAVTGTSSNGDAVLIRAGAVVQGGPTMLRNRGLADKGRYRPIAIAGGPARLCQALGVERSLDGHVLSSPPLLFAAGEPVEDREVVVGPRVGINYAGTAVSWPLRFALKDDDSVSSPRRALCRLTGKQWERIMSVAPPMTA